MFTGIIETAGKVLEVLSDRTSIQLHVSSPISNELSVNESVSHNGACLSITRVEKGSHWVNVVKESQDKSNLGKLVPGSLLNLERSMRNNGRFDGHLVQGHVDQVATVSSIRDEKGSWVFEFRHEPGPSNITVEKGSVCVNGISLTCYACTPSSFSTAVIPYTYEHTNMHLLKPGDTVNLEFDVIGKYIQRILSK